MSSYSTLPVGLRPHRAGRLVRVLALPFVVALAVGALSAQGASDVADAPPTLPEGAPDGTETIVAEDLRAHAYFLADDARGGRYTGTPGQIETARYVARHFESLGLEPWGDRFEQGAEPVDETGDGEPETGERSWFQRVPLERTHLADGSRLSFGDETFAEGYAILPGTVDRGCDVSGKLLWCGVGRRSELPRAEELEGRIPVVGLKVRDRGTTGLELLLGMSMQKMNKAKGMAVELSNRGAKALVVTLDAPNNEIAGFMNYLGLSPEKPILDYAPADDQFAMFRRVVSAPIPMIFLSAGTSAAVYEMLGVEGPETEEGKDDVEASLVLDVQDDTIEAFNVAAVLTGDDADLRDELVVYSAHMDHMGTRMDGDAYNGADDNASGTSALLEVAQAFVEGERPKRSVMFLSVCGEELGLWGSEHFAANPTWDLEALVANINIDMIGRNADLSGPREISITPSHRHPKYSSIGRLAAGIGTGLGLGLTIGDRFYERSDHYNFAKRGVPVVFFCDGEHEDYHQVTDTPDKLNYEKMELVTRLAFWTGTAVANAAERPTEVGRQKDW